MYAKNQMLLKMFISFETCLVVSCVLKSSMLLQSFRFWAWVGLVGFGGDVCWEGRRGISNTCVVGLG